ncbi:unnamed protein product [Brugia pahangi]|uniref:Photosystem I reaction center subunit VIII n=1 Tax=Brugia pahangi TaxID=6280 RepID=A0A0N4TBY4_BRUPA|nr:unnamed protein product [Brugia pahangi]
MAKFRKTDAILMPPIIFPPVLILPRPVFLSFAMKAVFTCNR